MLAFGSLLNLKMNFSLSKFCDFLFPYFSKITTRHSKTCVVCIGMNKMGLLKDHFEHSLVTKIISGCASIEISCV